MSSRIGRIVRHRVTITALVIVALGVGSLVVWLRWTTAQILKQGEQALEAREYSLAREKFELYLTDRPRDARARLLAARCARRMRAYYDAREHLRLCREAGGDTEALDVEEALIEVQRGDDRPVTWLRSRSDKGDELSLAILEVLIQYDLDTYQLWQALHGLNQFLTRRPDDLQALLGRARVWERFLYFKDALADYHTAVAAHPENELARLHLADTLLLVGTPDEALAEYQWLEKRWPQRAEVRLGLAKCHRQLGRAEDAKLILDGLIRESPNNGEALWERGQLAQEAGKPDEAEPLLRRAVSLLPYDRRISFSYYRCLLDLNRTEEAEKARVHVSQIDADIRRLDEIRQEVMRNPSDFALRYEGGLLFLRNGERQEAIRWLKIALKLKPDLQGAREALKEAE
jgi:tetratricopeptide (TPR) repeat protein